MMTDNDVARAFSQLADIILAEAEANYPTEDLGYEDLGYENFQDLQYRLGFDLS